MAEQEPITQFRNESGEDALVQRHATRVALIILTASLLIVLVYLTFSFQLDVWQMYTLTSIIATFSFLNYFAIQKIRKGDVEVGIWIILSGMMIVFPAAAFLVANVSIIFGITLFILTFTITNQVLPQKGFRISLILSGMIGCITASTDFLSLEYRLSFPLIQTFVPSITALIVLLVTFLFARRAWKRSQLKTKVTASFLLISFASLFTLGTLIFINQRNQIRENIQKNLLSLVSMAALQQDIGLHSSIQTQEDVNSEAYKLIQAKNMEFVKINPDIDSMYTMRMNEDGQLYFVVDATQPGDEDLALFAEIYEEPTPEMLGTFASEARSSSPG